MKYFIRKSISLIQFKVQTNLAALLNCNYKINILFKQLIESFSQTDNVRILFYTTNKKLGKTTQEK